MWCECMLLDLVSRFNIDRFGHTGAQVVLNGLYNYNPLLEALPIPCVLNPSSIPSLLLLLLSVEEASQGK